MNEIKDWSTITLEKLQDLWGGFLEFIPNLLAAIIVFVIGWIIASGVGKLVSGVLSRLKFNRLFGGPGWQEAMQKADLKADPAGFIGAIVKWVLVIVFLLAAVEIIGLDQFAEFLRGVVAWLPNLLVAAAIFVVAVIFADFLEKIVKASVRKLEIENVNLIGTIIRWSIYVFAGFAILLQLGITTAIINSIVVGMIATLSIAVGLAFGLGGKEAASKAIEEIKEKITERR
jgi:hypothetical protein